MPVRELMCSLRDWAAQFHSPQGSKTTLDPRTTMETQMRKALVRCHEYHGFFFFDLPGHICNKIYEHIFRGSEIIVCGFNKDPTTDEYAKDERCQILMTCQACLKEAMPIMYQTTNFIITKLTALDYFTWNEADQAKTAYITTLTLTQREVVANFEPYLCYFKGLRQLIVDFPVKIRRNGHLAPEDEFTVARLIRRGPWYAEHVGSLLPTTRSRSFFVAVVVHFNFVLGEDVEEQEMCMVDVDRMTIQRNYRTVEAAVENETLVMPSADDEQAQTLVPAPRTTITTKRVRPRRG